MPGGGLDEKIRRPYLLRNDVLVRVIAVNNSDQRIKVEVADSHYGDRHSYSGKASSSRTVVKRRRPTE